jgi:D-alanyl-lipoteichoic acid acyltransferase DltB (MBOAT superfamily)
MLFNSIEFFIFLPIVFAIFWNKYLKNLRAQNLIILLSSYFFYGYWDYRFLSLILISTIVDFTIGFSIHKEKSDKKRKFLLLISLFFNLGLLFFFKYFNFFIETFVQAVNINLNNIWTLNVILPVGISFYTFQTMSYTIDIYNKKLEPTSNFIAFASFVSFFPQLVAGPIERASNLLPQILNKRKFDYKNSVQGLRLVFYGLFKKVVIADSLAPEVNYIFSNYLDLGGGELWFGAFLFSFQIYCDFSGYSDIAIGVSKLLGFELMSNFKFPYFSRNIGEFWRRWHISLSTWFRDYLYIPLGGSRLGKFISIRNIFIIFIVSGIWHGANLTFLFWGLFHSLLFLPSFILKKNRKFLNSVVGKNKISPSFKELIQIISNFLLVTIGWVFFRSDSLTDAFGYYYKMFSDLSYDSLHIKSFTLITMLIFIDYRVRNDERLSNSFFKNKLLNYLFRLFMFVLIVYYFFLSVGVAEFIYFQF